MSGYWELKARQLDGFRHARSFSEDWAKKTVSFEIGNPNGTCSISFWDLKNLSAFFGTESITMLASTNTPGVMLMITARDVAFPNV